MPRLYHPLLLPALGCLCLVACTGSVAKAQLSISLDDDNVQLQNGTSPPLVVGPGQSFGGQLTPQGFQGVMVGPKGATKVMPRPMTNPFREAPSATPSRLKIKAGDVSLSLPTATMPMDASTTAKTSLPRQKLLTAREMVRKGDFPAARQQLDKMLRDYAPDAELLQLKALVMLQMNEDREAAACVYDALAMAKPWDWSMLRSAMPHKEASTELYRRLQQKAQAKPSLQMDFLLAWWERMLDHKPESLRALRAAAAAQPKDPLFARLLSDWSAMEDDDLPPAVQP